MGSKLLWTGLTIITALPIAGFSGFSFIGAIIMIIGLILLWLDK